MPNLQGIKALQVKLKKLADDSKKVSVVVGYSGTNYGVHVHENLAMNHPNGGQAKFLEQPAREMGKELGDTAKKVVANGGTLEQGLIIAGLKLQRESQKLVPVDTGALKNSAYTKKETVV